MGSASERTDPAGLAEGDEIARLGEPRALEPGEVGAASDSIARAFAWHEPWAAWALPGEASREATLAGLIEANVRERFLPRGEAWTIGAASVTLWIPPASVAGSEVFARRRSDADYAVYGARGAALRSADRMLARMLPVGDHWYLDTIATAPEWRRAGLGARLLDHDLAIRDSRGEACALDTHTADNVAFYERRGFEVIARDVLPEGGPDLIVMRRPALA